MQNNRKVIFVTDGKDAKTVESFAQYLSAHVVMSAKSSPQHDMSPAFIKGVTDHLPNARITSTSSTSSQHASTAVDKTPVPSRSRSRTERMRWALLKDRSNLLLVSVPTWMR